MPIYYDITSTPYRTKFMAQVYLLFKYCTIRGVKKFFYYQKITFLQNISLTTYIQFFYVFIKVFEL